MPGPATRGILFFTRRSRPVFDAWAASADRLDPSIEWTDGTQVRRMPCNDQAGFARAIEDTDVSPFVLPRPAFHIR